MKINVFLESWVKKKTEHHRNVFHEDFDWNFNLFHPISAFHRIKLKNEYHHRILHPKWPIKHVSSEAHVTFSFGDFIWADLDIYLNIMHITYLYATFAQIEKPLAKFDPQVLSVLSWYPTRRKVAILAFGLTLTCLVTFLRKK